MYVYSSQGVIVWCFSSAPVMLAPLADGCDLASDKTHLYTQLVYTPSAKGRHVCGQQTTATPPRTSPESIYVHRTYCILLKPHVHSQCITCLSTLMCTPTPTHPHAPLTPTHHVHVHTDTPCLPSPPPTHMNDCHDKACITTSVDAHHLSKPLEHIGGPGPVRGDDTIEK